MSLLMRAAVRGERLVYRTAGLPVAIRGLLNRHGRTSGQIIRSAYALAYW